jgi:hypothetical protein
MADLRSPLSLMLADADDMKDDEYNAVLDLKPASLLVCVYPHWDHDKGVAERTRSLVRALGHTTLLVRFHADPSPPAYAAKNGGPEAWGRLCAKRMTQYYGDLEGVTLGVILANEVDADFEGNLNPVSASSFYRRAFDGYLSIRPDDEMHVPAPTGAPETHRRYLQQYKRDGWLRPKYILDGHAYNGDFLNVANVLWEECPENQRDCTETNDIADFQWMVDSIADGHWRRVHWFILLWAHGGEGRVQPPSADDAAKQMSLLRFPARYAQFKATITELPDELPETPEPIPQEPAPIMTIYEQFIREAARVRGIDPDIAVRVANSEGSVTEPARLGDFSGPPLFSGKSWWPFQLHYGGAGYEHFGTVAGMGNGFTALTGWQPGDPNAWRDATRYALNRAKASGWGAWYGAAHVGIGRWDGIDRNHPWDAAAEPWDYETGVAPVAVTYNANEPAHPQDKSFDCSQESLEWALYALGRSPQDNWMEPTMIDEGVMSPSLGLLDASGAGLAAFVGRHYGEFGFYANHEPSVSFEGVSFEGEHKYPLLIGGRAWNHWAGVRGYDATRDVLLLANPSDGWMGVRQEMTREQFATLGPFSMVRVLHPDLLDGFTEPAPPVEPPAPEPSRVSVLLDEIDARVAELRSLVA